MSIDVDWLVLCESAHFDSTHRLCVIGIAKHFPVPTLPVVLHEHTLVAHLAGVTPRSEFDVAFGVRTPSGCWISPEDDDAASLTVVDGYVLITLRSLPFMEVGTYRFEVSANREPPAVLEIPVWLTSSPALSADVH